jgi:hypothetical protein
MAIPSSGPLSLDDIQTEFGGTNPIDLSEYYAGGANVPPGTTGDSGPIPTSGEIAVGEFYGSSNRVPIVINNTGTTLRADIYALASADPTYSAGITDVVYNNSGTLYSNVTGGASLRTGTFASGDTVKIVNTGLIIGKGGDGGDGNPTSINFPSHVSGNGPGGAGGRALALQFPVTIDNTGGTIAGGGGGGAGAFSVSWTTPNPNGPKNPPITRTAGGSGGGGGAGTDVGTGGAGGTAPSPIYTGNAGSNGTPTAGGSGGASNNQVPGPLQPYAVGANGGGRGQAGSPKIATNPSFEATGGAAGQAIISNSNTITWIDMGTINGPTT